MHADEIEITEKCARILMRKKTYERPADLLEQALAAKRVNEDDPLAKEFEKIYLDLAICYE